MDQIPFQFRDILARYVKRSGYTAGQLSKLSAIPKMTILNWLEGRVKKPRVRHDLLKLATVLHLSETEATMLLRAAGQPTIAELLLADNQEERELLAPWAAAMRQQPTQAPFQVIADLPYFVGREQELRALREALLAGQHVTIYSVQGMGGVGKTTLAAHIAYQLRPHFPDGVLWARVDAADPLSILRAFAHAYGHDVSMHQDLESRSQAVRAILADKRALIVLDNVWGSAEVEPLVPPTGACAVIVTTRRHDLAATRGARRFGLTPFDRERREALDLFDRMLGPERAQREQAQLAAVADALGHLPLAIAIVAGRMVYEPGWTAAAMLERVRQEQSRLNELVYEDQSVRLSYNLSYAALPPDQQQFFAALGTFGGEDFSPEAAAFVAGVPRDTALDQLRKLYGLSLVQQGRPGRYQLHPLLRDYAREHLHDGTALARMVEFFAGFVEAHGRDYDRLDLESGNIIAALETAAERSMGALLIRSANAFYPFLEVRGMYELAEAQLQRARAAAETLGDQVGGSNILHNQGRIAERRGDYARAEAQHQEGLVLARAVSHREWISALLTELGLVLSHQGKYDQAEAHWQEGLALARAIDDRERIVILLTALGVGARRQGNIMQAEAYWQEGLALARSIGFHESMSLLLSNLGGIAGQRGDYRQAEALLREGLTLARLIGHRERMILLLSNLGLVAHKLNDYGKAEARLQEALALARAIGHRERLGMLLANLAEIAAQRGADADAEAYFQEGLELARAIGNKWLMSVLLHEWGAFHFKRERLASAGEAFDAALEIAQAAGLQEYEARALYSLAQVAAAQRGFDAALRQGQESLAIFEATGHPKATEVAEWLRALPSAQDNATNQRIVGAV